MQRIGQRSKGRFGIGAFIACCYLLLAAWAEAGVPVVSSQQVTDVATRSFSVILTVSEPSTALLALFAADCTTPALDFSTTRQENLASGNMRLTVSGLNAASDYCYQLAITSTASGELTTTPAAPVTTAVAIVRTATSGQEIVPSVNDIVQGPAVFLPAGESRDTIISTLELADATAIAPLSLLLASDPNRDYFNLNNLFSAATGTTLPLLGGERVKLTENHGTSGCVIELFRRLPAASGGTTARTLAPPVNPLDIDASGGVNILDVLRVVAGKGMENNGLCFNSDLDLNADDSIDSADLILSKGGFNGNP